jgi:hypothetical protein
MGVRKSQEPCDAAYSLDWHQIATGSSTAELDQHQHRTTLGWAA